MAGVYTLSKEERLFLRDAILRLFSEGKSFMIPPYRIKYRVLPESDAQSACVAIMAIAPKKRFKHAVDRNRVKRLTREAYRLNKLPLVDAFEKAHCKLQVAFIFNNDEQVSFAETEKVMKKIIQQLVKRGVKKVVR